MLVIAYRTGLKYDYENVKIKIKRDLLSRDTKRGNLGEQNERY
jgi:hypothetical protein